MCDGAEVADEGPFTKICQILRDHWGPIKSEGGRDYCKLPNLQGVFLRGVNKERKINDVYVDQDVSKRTTFDKLFTNSYLSIDKAHEVGSYQRDSIMSHKHWFTCNEGNAVETIDFHPNRGKKMAGEERQLLME